MVERVATGIKGFDALIEGGWPKGNAILVSGSPGTGKSIFCMQALYNNSLKGKKCLYVSFEQTEAEIKEQMRQFGWTKLNSNFKILAVGSDDIALADNIISSIKKDKPELVVVDSVASIFGSTPKEGKNWTMREVSEMVYPSIVDESTMTRMMIKSIVLGVKETGVTAFFISEIIKDSPGYSRDTISEFLCDAILMMHAVEGEEGFRTLTIPKARMTKQRTGIYSFEIGKNGFMVKSQE